MDYLEMCEDVWCGYPAIKALMCDITLWKYSDRVVSNLYMCTMLYFYCKKVQSPYFEWHAKIFLWGIWQYKSEYLISWNFHFPQFQAVTTETQTGGFTTITILNIPAWLVNVSGKSPTSIALNKILKTWLTQLEL